MKKLQSVLCLLLLFSFLFLTACGSNSGSSSTGNATQGRYIEKDITPPTSTAELLTLLQTKEGKLVTFNRGLVTRYESSDLGATWQESPGPGKDSPELGDAYEISMMEDGTILVLVNANPPDMQGMPTSTLYKITPEGKVEPLAIPDFDEVVAEGNKPSVEKLLALPQNRILLSFSWGGGNFMFGGSGESSSAAEPVSGSSHVESPSSATGNSASTGSSPTESGPGQRKAGLYDFATGKLIADITNDFGMTAAANSDNLYLSSHQGGYTVFNLADGSQKSSIPGETSGQFNFSSILFVGSDGNIYTADNKEVRRINATDGTSESVFNASIFAIGDPNNRLQSVIQLSNGSFVAQVYTSETNSKIYAYTYDPNAKVDPAKTLKIWTLHENSALRAGISAFMKKNPDATINLEVALAKGDAQKEEDAIRNLNTRILSGDGPDIMLLDGAPAQSYADKGMLLNLAKLVDTSTMYEQIRSSFETEKGTFYLPTRFKAPMLLGAATDLQDLTLQKLLDAAQNGKDTPLADSKNSDPFASLPQEERPAFNFSDLREAFDILWNSSASGVLTQNGLDKETLAKLLTALKTLSDKYKLADPDAQTGGGMAMFSSGGGDATVISGSALAYTSQRANYGSMTLADLLSTSFLKTKDTLYKPFPGLVEGAWLPVGLVGINASTKVQDLAVAFLQAMMSDDVQGSFVTGIPVTASGVAKQIATINEYPSESNQEKFDFDVAGLVAQFKTPIITDASIQDIFFGNAKSFCAGEFDLDATITRIEQATSTYLAERK